MGKEEAIAQEKLTKDRGLRRRGQRMEPGNRMRCGSWVLRDRLQQMGLTLPQILSEIKNYEEMANRTKWGREHQTEREVRAPSSGSTFLSKRPLLSGLWFPHWPRQALPSSPMLMPRPPGQSRLQARGQCCPHPCLTVSDSWATTCQAW